MTAISAARSFRWQGIDQLGQRLTGTESSEDAATLTAQLRQKGIVVTRIRRDLQLPLGTNSRIKTAQRVVFCRQLATLVSAGLPLTQGLGIAAEQADNSALKRIIQTLQQDVEAGQPLSASLAKHPSQFDNLFVQLVVAGEQSGTLDIMLQRLATHQEKSLALRRKTQRAMYYPATVLCVALAVTALMLVKVVPQFESLFLSTGASLPWLTQTVISASTWLQKHVITLAIMTFGSVFAVLAARRSSEKFHLLFDTVALRLPVIGRIMQQAATARFSRTFSTLIAAGVPVVETLEIVAGSSGNLAYERAIRELHAQLLKGQSFSQALESSQLFPAITKQMFAIGEESGTIEVMTAKVADTMEREVDESVETLSSLMEPLIILFIGLLVGTLVASMYLPIFKIAMTF